MDTEVILRLRDRLVSDGRPSLVPSVPRGLEDLTPYEMASLERVEPLAELLFLAMCADGRVDSREEATLRGTVRTLTDGLLRGHTSDRLVERFRDDLEREGYDERLFHVTQRLAGDRDDSELAVLLFAAVVLSDGELDDQERAAFDRVTGELGVGPRRVRELLDGV